jgi:AraC-like DNA-binding protein
MDNNYISWPAKAEDLIEVAQYIGDTPVSLHRHDFIEIVFMAYGSCRHQYHGTELTLIPGDVFIVIPHEEHSYLITSKTVIYNCLFYPEALGEDWKHLKEMGGLYDFLMVEPFYRSELNHQEILHLQPAEVLTIEVLLKQMIAEKQNRQTGFQLALKANLIMLLALLGRSWEKQFSGQPRFFDGKREMLAEALHYIEQNLNRDLKVGELAARVYLSPDYFRKIFRDITGLTPIDYINKIRIAKAIRILDAGKYTISEVAEMVGVNDLNYFSRLFHSIAGCSPSQYLKKHD